MARNWIEFDEEPPNLGTGMYVSLNTEGEIYFNRKVYEAFGEPKAVKMLYSETTNCIGLRRAEILTPNAHKIKPKHKGHLLRANRFVKRHEIKYDGTAQFLDTTIDEGVLVLNLKRTRIVRKRRKPQTDPRR